MLLEVLKPRQNNISWPGAAINARKDAVKNIENHPKMRLGGQRTPKRINKLNFELAARKQVRQNGNDHNRLMLKSNANSSSDSNQNNRKRLYEKYFKKI